MTSIHASEIPWKDGLPLGSYTLHHASPTYSTAGFGYDFENGRTKVPVGGRTLARLLASQGSEFTIFAGDEETSRLVASHLTLRGRHDRAAEVLGGHGAHETVRVAEARSAPEVAEASPEQYEQPEPREERVTAPEAAVREVVAPKTFEALNELSDDDLRTLGAQLGITDKRLGVAKLRRIVADELGL